MSKSNQLIPPPTDLQISNGLLDKAVKEIEQIRESNRYMSARLTMFDTVVQLVKTDISGKYQGDCCGHDLVQQIKSHTGKE